MPPEGEEGGAELMVKQGCLDNPKVDAVFGLHVTSTDPTGVIGWRSGPVMAAADVFKVFIRGSQTHGAMPWRGVDPIVVGAQVVTGLQTIVSRRLNITQEPSVVTVGVFQGGVRNNIIPDEVKLEGTIRTFDEGQRNEVHEHVTRISEMIAAAGGAKAHVHIRRGYPVTDNDPALTDQMMPTLRRVVAPDRLRQSAMITGAEDFSLFQKKAPGVFLFLGIVPREQDHTKAPANHSPYFFADESALPVGVRALSALALDYLMGTPR